MLKKLSLISASAISAFAMHTAEINVNDTDLEIGAKLDIAQFNNTTEPDTIFTGVRFLHATDKNSDFAKGTIKDFYELNFLMKREVSTSPLAIGLGVKLNHTESFTTIPLGVELSYELPAGDVIPLYLSGSLYYAPEVLSMENAKNFLEYRVSFDMEVIEHGNITVGYRSIQTNYVARDMSYNKSAYIGFKFAF